MKHKAVNVPNLVDITFAQALELARTLSGMTYEEISEQSGKKLSTIHRYFTDATYNPPSYLIPRLCRVLGNDILIEWQAAHAGGVFNRLINHNEDEDIESNIADVMREVSHLLQKHSLALKEKHYTVEELRAIRKETADLLHEAMQLSMSLDARIAKAAGI